MTTSTFKRFAIPAALVVGGVTVGSLLAPIGLVSADEAESDSDSTGGDATSADGSDEAGYDHHHHGRFGRRAGVGAEVLEETLGLSAEEIRDAMGDGNSLADVAEAQGVAVDDLTAALVAAATEHIDQAVVDGKIDAEAAEERKAGLEERIAAMVQRVPSGDGIGHRGGPFRGGLETVEEVLGLSAEEIRDGMAEGKTLSDLAEEQGVAADALADALLAQASDRIDEAVAAGKIDEDRAATAKEHLEERIDQAVEAEPFALGRGIGRAESRRLRFHHRNHHHGDHAADEADEAGDGTADDGTGDDVVDSSLTDA